MFRYSRRSKESRKYIDEYGMMRLALMILHNARAIVMSRPTYQRRNLGLVVNLNE